MNTLMKVYKLWAWQAQDTHGLANIHPMAAEHRVPWYQRVDCRALVCHVLCSRCWSGLWAAVGTSCVEWGWPCWLRANHMALCFL